MCVCTYTQISLFADLILNMVPLNVYVIVYEMSWQLGPRNGILLAKKILSQCYAIATIGAFGTIFMTEYEEGEDDVDECVKVTDLKIKAKKHALLKIIDDISF